MDLFKLVAKIGLDDSEYQKKVEGVRAKTIMLGNLMADMVKKGANIGVGLVKTGMAYNRQMEDYTTNFKVMLGSLTAAQAKVEELKTMAAKTPFAMEDLAGATQTLLAFGVQSEKTTSVIQRLGDISLGNAQRMDSLSRAYGKAAAQGKLTGEVVQMMVDAGFNPLLQISEATGESMEALQKRMSAGAVSVDELDLALRRATSEGGQFYKGMEEASKTLSGQLSTLEDNWNALLGKAMSPVSEQLSDKILPKAIESLDRLSDALFGVGTDAESAKKKLFLDTEGNEIDPSTNLLTWVQDVMTEWTNGVKEDQTTVQGYVDTFNANTESIKAALLKRIEDTTNPMTEEEITAAQAKIAEIEGLQNEVETLLQKRAGGYITADEEKRLNTIVETLSTMQQELETSASFEENIVTPWERMVNAAGDIAADGIDKLAGFLEWCAADGDNAGEALTVIASGLGGLVGLKLGVLVAGPVGGLIGLLAGASAGTVITNLGKITNKLREAANQASRLLGLQSEVLKYGNVPSDVLAYRGKTGKAVATSPTTGYIDEGSHAVGLDYVPYNEYRALLHEGEAVLTKSEANAWRKGEGKSAVWIDYEAIGDAVAAALERAGLAFNVNGRTLAYATAGDNARAANARRNDINIGKVRG